MPQRYQTRVYLIQDRLISGDEIIREIEVGATDEWESAVVEHLKDADEPLAVFETRLVDGAVLRDVSEDMAARWWVDIASEVAFGQRVLPPFIRDRINGAALFAALNEKEQYHFAGILGEGAREEAQAYEGRGRER